MTNELSDIPEGTLVSISEGCYSDYGLLGIFRAVKPIPVSQLRSQWLQRHAEQNETYHFETMRFLAWVYTEGYLEHLDYVEWHLADYSSPDEMAVWSDFPYRWQPSKENDGQ